MSSNDNKISERFASLGMWIIVSISFRLSPNSDIALMSASYYFIGQPKEIDCVLELRQRHFKVSAWKRFRLNPSRRKKSLEGVER